MTKILLVEDDKSLREIYGTRLYAEGYDIVSAGDGEEALAMAIKERPNLILSDVMMPKISGFDMLDILRSTTETKDIKVIMMTALSSEDQRQRGEALGADRYLVKSQVGIEDVVRTVHEVLGDALTPPAPATPPTIAPTPAPQAVAMPPIATPTPAAPPPPPNTPPVPPQPADPTAEAALPQPIAPFSTPRPAGLGDRVIQPLTDSIHEDNNIADLINQELTNTKPAATPPSSSTPPAISPVTAPAAPVTGDNLPPLPPPLNDPAQVPPAVPPSNIPPASATLQSETSQRQPIASNMTPPTPDVTTPQSPQQQ